MSPLTWIRARLALRRRQRALARLERATGTIRHANVRLVAQKGSLALLIEDLANAELRLVRLSPDDAYRLGRDLVKRSRRAGA